MRKFNIYEMPIPCHALRRTIQQDPVLKELTVILGEKEKHTEDHKHV